MLNLQAVNHFYGNQHSLWNVDLELRPGECIGVLGREGMGKTTLVNCIAGHLPVASGRMTWHDIGAPPQDLTPLSAQSRSAIGIGYVPQNKRIFSQLSVEENLHIALAAGKPGANASGGEIYEHFPELYALRQRKGASLSDDDQYQLALARALIVQPRLLILDEPSRGRGPRCLQKLADLLLRLNRDIGLTVLLAEQHLPFIRRVADRFCVLHRGRNVAEGDIMALDEPLLAQWMTPDPAP
ncbi:ABC transporter ATP-binding protein [Klebsiella quasipneumoniae]|uniref:ABC transporter ATP-binding protein n=1 Tax=Klebsiella quasipneumoniae TaxID=1463165 RepID=UPI0011B3A002|nr:ATP-binding cassette domain-containing protein [Klebsiella quasipneumoniae]ELJ5745656.1 ATP-binding cassette domain-containing protein [Klebsiella quasipneumoniae]TWV30040.1 ATP-binding cassette domain-containing protein [Klebsiella quasipneumoniae subsp. similipneumoniae]HBR0757463.1 ATP-binding cassette domain-containing protein [Klebsiella quasipneumoniae]HBR1933474.1 ATP-binding cassette domain-containing protein [Klebsiella quasipneumoniae subsp. similipneumoniae]